MRKISLILMPILIVLLCCSCSAELKSFTTYNTNIYWGMTKVDAEEILSQKYRTVNFGDTITYSIFTSEDFLKPDTLVATVADVEYKFENDKLVKITQSYSYDSELPESMGALFNTYLYIALEKNEEAELHEHYMDLDNEKLLMLQFSSYETETEDVKLYVNYNHGLSDDEISVSFEPKVNQ